MEKENENVFFCIQCLLTAIGILISYSVLGQDCIVFIDDFMINKTPSSNGKKFYIFSPSSHGKATDHSKH